MSIDLPLRFALLAIGTIVIVLVALCIGFLVYTHRDAVAREREDQWH